MAITYATDQDIEFDQFIDILKRSRLAERRPIHDIECMHGALENSDLVVTAWDGDLLVGISRCITDFHYVCYISGLAVDEAYQGRGIGTELIIQTQEKLGPRCKIVLLAAPGADKYYSRLGFKRHPSAWMLERHRTIKRR